MPRCDATLAESEPSRSCAARWRGDGGGRAPAADEIGSTRQWSASGEMEVMVQGAAALPTVMQRSAASEPKPAP